MLKNKYGKNFPRRTELRNFDTIEAAKVVEANEKLYINDMYEKYQSCGDLEETLMAAYVIFTFSAGLTISSIPLKLSGI